MSSAWNQPLSLLTILTRPDKLLAVHVKVREVVLGLILGRGTQTLIVLDLPAASAAAKVFFPRLVFRHGVENLHLPATASLQD